MTGKVYVVGVGMTKFEKPGGEKDYPDFAKEAAIKALADAGVAYKKVEQAVVHFFKRLINSSEWTVQYVFNQGRTTVGYVYGDSTCGQRSIYEVGLTGIPIYNVNNNCSTGSTALFMAKQLVEGGVADCVMALGFEKMQRGSLKNHFDDRTTPMDKHVMAMLNTREMAKAPMAPQLFGNAGREHMEKYNTTTEQFAKVAEKNHRHSANNPYSQFREVYTLDEILASPKVYEPLTKLQCCPTSDGAACAILCSEKFVLENNLESQAIEIAGMSMATDFQTSFQNSNISNVGSDMSKSAAKQAFEQAGITANDVQVVELHDCFSCNELVTYEALGLCAEGEGGKLIESGNATFGGKYVINPSGGLISKGHPLGATGLAQCAELNWQLRKMAGQRQVKGVNYALQHNIGLGGAAVVSIYKIGFPSKFKEYSKSFNPAVSSEFPEELKSSFQQELNPKL